MNFVHGVFYMAIFSNMALRPPYNVHVGFLFIPQGNEKNQQSILKCIK